MKTISIVNLKGGVGKTVTTVNMASRIAASGNKVLVVDADPQANASAFLLERFRSDEFMTLADIMAREVDYLYDAIYETTIADVNCVPSDISLIEADIASVRHGSTCNALKNFLDELELDNKAMVSAGEEAYCDYVLIDCPPSFTAASVAAISASDEIIIPVKIDAFSVSGMRELLAQIDGVKRINNRVSVAGILITMWHNAPAVVQGEALLRRSGIPVFDTHIRRSDKVDESTFARQALDTYSKTSSAGRDYQRFVTEFLEKEARKNG